MTSYTLSLTERVVKMTEKPADSIIGLPSSVCAVDCVLNGLIGDQISIFKSDALGF